MAANHTSPSNTLFYGDCLRVLSDDLTPQSVDLIYLDPPFNSKRDYNIPLGGKAQASVFQDTWVWSDTQDESLEYVAARDAELYKQLGWLLKYAAGGNIAAGGGLPAYLAYMAARLLACQRVLKDTGSIYLHCDPTAGHYLKLLMDGVFGAKNFRNAIYWRRVSSTQKGSQFGSTNWGNNTDVILFFAKSRSVKIDSMRQLTDEEVKEKFNLIDDNGDRYYDDSAHIWRTPNMGPRPNLCYEWRGFVNPHSSGWRLKKERLEEEYQKGNFVILSNGKLQRRKYQRDYRGTSYGNFWDDIVMPLGKERLGYPTQKPLALLERIINASSNPGDLVLDPFCGCGTAVEAAQNLGRRWLGIDVEPLAVDLMARRLRERCGIEPAIRGIPYDFPQAQRLAASAPYEFERWAIRLIPGAQPNFKQSGDGGLDGRAIIHTGERPQPLFGFQVKGGQQVGRPALDAFHGALTMNGCAAGLMVVLQERTANYLRGQLGAQERVRFGDWRGGRIGVWSVQDWLEGGRKAPVPQLVGAGETMDLLQPRNWQRRLSGGAS